jgi:hypothetical protein
MEHWAWLLYLLDPLSPSLALPISLQGEDNITSDIQAEYYLHHI